MQLDFIFVGTNHQKKLMLMMIQTLRKIFGLFYDSYSSFFLVSVTDLSIFPHPGDAAEEVRGAVKSSPLPGGHHTSAVQRQDTPAVSLLLSRSWTLEE